MIPASPQLAPKPAKRIYRAEPPQAPKPTAEMLADQAEKQLYLREREAVESRGQVRALLLLAIVVLLFSVARAGMGRVFVPGWWRQW